MNSEAIQHLISDFARLSISDRETFMNYIAAHSVPADERFIVDTRFEKGLVCPHCGAKGRGVSKAGIARNGRQRFVCHHCKHTFTATTGSVIYNSKKSLTVWRNFILHFFQGTSVRKTAEILGINKNTAFLWRHKLADSLDVIMQDIKMEGIVEADETFIRFSAKGNKKAFKNGQVGRKPYKRSRGLYEKHLRGLSMEQTCIPCLVNRSGQSVAKVAELGKGSFKGIDAVIGDHIIAGSTLCADGAAAYGRVAAAHGLERVKMTSSTSVKGFHSIQHINAYHSGLKNSLRRFCGVSTKHLNNYLLWFNFCEYAKESYGEKVRLIVKHMIAANVYTRRCELAKRPLIPCAYDKTAA